MCAVSNVSYLAKYGDIPSLRRELVETLGSGRSLRTTIWKAAGKLGKLKTKRGISSHAIYHTLLLGGSKQLATDIIRVLSGDPASVSPSVDFELIGLVTT